MSVFPYILLLILPLGFVNELTLYRLYINIIYIYIHISWMLEEFLEVLRLTWSMSGTDFPSLLRCTEQHTVYVKDLKIIIKILGIHVIAAEY